MSLNGLDGLDVKEAHDAAIAEPGGWFLLKYASRDEVDILGRGNGGILEIRKAIASYEDPSPLFGFLRYRRRSVVIKYVPEGCSRLVQARVTVHFNAVTDWFSPHDTVFSIGTAKELKDSALSAACSLHTASGSTSSSTSSLRRRRLMEIAEDEEEDRRQSTVMEERASTIKASSIDGSAESPLGDSSSPETPELLTSLSYQTFNTEPTTEPDSDALSLAPSISFDPSIHSATDYDDSPRKSTDQGRSSFQDARPELNSYHSYSSNGRPKVKLGPRPSLDTAGRPQTSGSTNYRPVSTLPAGLKLFSRSSKRPNERPQSQFPTTTPSMTISPPAMNEVTETSNDDPLARPHTSEGRPTTSSGVSFKSTMSTSTLTSKTPSITPEKARLMKALELRKKKMHAPRPELLLPLPPSDGPDKETTVDSPASVTTLDDVDSMSPSQNGVSNEYSGVPSTTEFGATANSGTPASPFALSEQAESTPASSVSDSTDETIQDSNENRKTIILHDTKSETEPTRNHDDQNTGPVEKTKAEELPEPLETVLQPEEIAESGHAADQHEISSSEVPKSQESTSTDIVVPIDEMRVAVITESKPEFQVNSVTPADEVSQDSPSAIDEGSAAHHPESLEQPAAVLEDDKKTVEFEVLVEISPPAVKTPVREMRIPRSKFSVQNLKENDSPISSSGKDATKPTERNADAENSSPKKRKVLMEPIRTDLRLNQMSRPTSEVDLFNDDDLMDELQSATMQEAKPVSVSKSPMKSLFPQDVRKGSNVSDRFSRAFSNPLLKNEDHLSPHKSEPSRSVSASAYLNRINQQQQAAPLAKKVNLGSGISQRIKALEKLSSTGAGSASSPGAGVTAGPSPTFFAVRKSNTAGSKSPSIAERANSLTRHTPSPSISRESSPEQLKNRDRSFSIQSRKDALNSSPTNAPTRSRPESISVTARIIRDPTQAFPPKSDVGKNILDNAPLDLKQSPLVIDHQRAILAVAPEPTKEMIQERRLSNPPKGGKKERRSSITVVKELISETRNSFAERRKSMTIEPRPPSTHQNSPSVPRPLSISSRRSSRDYGSILSSSSTNVHSPSTSEENIEKKGSRASRMLHRMSSSLSSGRKTLAHAMSPTVREEESEPPSTGISMSPSYISMMSGPATTIVEMGDVNVQFPDNLLWKRRAMRLDSQGFLILTQSQAGKATEKSAGVKKYHLRDFRTPAIPDMEVEELPNSVVLDFVDGSGLQFACEDRGGQLWVLQKLQEAHSTWAANGQ